MLLAAARMTIGRLIEETEVIIRRTITETEVVVDKPTKVVDIRTVETSSPEDETKDAMAVEEVATARVDEVAGAVATRAIAERDIKPNNTSYMRKERN
jgi:hypothetical protein